VLINGQRVSGKASDLATELSRIPAQNVIEIRIVDGATLDIPGLSGQVADIIVQARTRISGQFSWRPEFRTHTTDPLLSRGDVSITGARGPFEWSLALQNSSSRSGADGPTWIYGRTGALIETRDDIWTGSGETPQLSGRLAYRGPDGDVGNLSAVYRQSEYDYREHGFRDRVTGPDVDRRVWSDDDTTTHEISGHYEFALGAGRLKLIGLIINFGCGVVFGFGEFCWAGMVLIFANLFDMLDGGVARLSGRVTKYGSFLDSTLDRLSDMGSFMGIMIFYARLTEFHSTLNVFLAGAGMIA